MTNAGDGDGMWGDAHDKWGDGDGMWGDAARGAGMAPRSLALLAPLEFDFLLAAALRGSCPRPRAPRDEGMCGVSGGMLVGVGMVVASAGHGHDKCGGW